jgi:hypothetical protein
MSNNISVVAERLAELETQDPDLNILEEFIQGLQVVNSQSPRGYIGGIDSSDNLLLNIPQHPGAAIAGYSFSLVVTNPDGDKLFQRKRLAEFEDMDSLEELEIALVYNVPGRQAQRKLRIAEYQLRTLLPLPRTASPYRVEEKLPELKVRLLAARQREMTERQAIMTALHQREIISGVSRMDLLLKDGRLSSQNVQPRFMDEVGRTAVERGVRLLGVIKQGSSLWSQAYPYHRELYRINQGPYWAIVPPRLLWDTYDQEQYEPKTLMLGSQENRSLGGIGGLWVMYGSTAKSFHILEFNVYDLERYRPLVENSTPLSLYNSHIRGWSKGTFVVEMFRENEFRGTQLDVSDKDFSELIAPTVNELHYLTENSRSLGYPSVLADAHYECKITSERKSRLNNELIARMSQLGFDTAEFDTWSADPHKMFEL